MKTRSSILSVLVLLAAGLAFGEPAAGSGLAVRVFQFHHKQAENAAIVIRPLVSAEGSISIQPGSNTLVVTDHAENLKTIGSALADFDSPSRGMQLQIRLVSASRQAAPSKVPDDLKEISSKLSGVLRFNSFAKVGEVVADGKEGDPVITRLDGYRADFKFGEYDPLAGTLRISSFQLSRVKGDEDGSELVPVLKTEMNLRLGQMHIVGISRDPDSQRALMLVLVASASK